MSTAELINRIAAEAASLGICPAATSAWKADITFGRSNSGAIWDRVFELQMEKKQQQGKKAEPAPPTDPTCDEPNEDDDGPDHDPDEDEYLDDEDSENETTDEPTTKRGLFRGEYFGYPA